MLKNFINIEELIEVIIDSVDGPNIETWLHGQEITPLELAGEMVAYAYDLDEYDNDYEYDVMGDVLDYLMDTFGYEKMKYLLMSELEELLTVCFERI